MTQNRLLLLFDIDGTLVRMRAGCSADILRRVFLQVFGRELPHEAIGDLGGKTDMQIFREICTCLGIENADDSCGEAEFRAALESELELYSHSDHIDLLPGVGLLLERLRHEQRVTLGLVTGNFRSCAYAKLRPHGLDGYFTVGAFGCDHHNRRALPPLAIGRANSKAGEFVFGAHNSVVIGDTPLDIDCARANSLRVAAVATGRSTARELMDCGPDIVFDNFLDTERVLSALLDELWK